VQGITGDRAAAQARVAEVATHYRQLGGFSPFNELTLQQARNVATHLKDKGLHLPIYVGMRHWPPYVQDVLGEMTAQGMQQTLAVIMAPHQCFASWDWYQQTVEAGLATLHGRGPHITYLAPWYTQPGFITAIADYTRQADAILGRERAEQAALIYTAHAIPEAMAHHAPYVQQFEATAAAATRLLGRRDCRVAYQSQVTGTPRPWVQPDINDAIRQAKADGYDDVIVSPIGFLCDHVEVLYDLDVAAKQTAETCGMTFVRVKTVGNHPAFIAMLGDLIAERFLKG
jgi:ferrochelatase